MLVQTFSVTKANNQLSSIFQTTNGLIQGAICSPLLFNIYINELANKLDKLQHIGITLTYTRRVNTLFFADDIVIFAETNKGLHALLECCKQYFKKWKLELNVNKSALMHKLGSQLDQETIDNFSIKQLSTGFYKYLGIPFSRLGINRKMYFSLIKEAFTKASFAMASFCSKYHIPEDRRVSIYKTVVRSRLEYGCQIINYDPEWLRELEQLQIQCLKRLMPSALHKASNESILLTFNLETIQSRFDTLKIQFYHKLTIARNSLANKVVTYIRDTKGLLGVQTLMNEPYINNIKDALYRYGTDIKAALWTGDNTMPQEDAKNVIASKISQHSKQKLIQAVRDRVQRHNLYKNQYNSSVMSPLETLAWESINTKTSKLTRERYIVDTPNDIIALHKPERFDKPILNTRYIPHCVHNIRYEIWRYILLHQDDGWQWQMPHVCEKCGQTIQGTLAHELLECESSAAQRDQLLMQLYHKLNMNIDAHNSDLFNYLDSTLIDNDIPDTEQLETILQIFIIPENDGYTSRKDITIIRTFLILLAASQLTNFQTKLYSTATTEIRHKQQTYNVDTSDYLDNKLCLLSLYNSTASIVSAAQVGINPIKQRPSFGSASERAKDEALTLQAHQYAETQILSFKDRIRIYTDGSVRAKGTQSGAGIVIEQSNDIITDSISLNTKSIACAELSAIIRALELLQQRLPNNKQNIAIFCDNQYVVNISNLNYQPKRTHAQQHIKLQQTLFKLRQTNDIQIIWIPSHCNITLHDKADKLATQAAKQIAQRTEAHSGWGHRMVLP